MPVRGILSNVEVSAMAERVKKLGGQISYKDNADGSKSPYELNINFLDALGNPGAVEASNALIAKRFLASQAIMLVLKGIPGIYFHSLIGSRNWTEGVKKTGRARTINREKLDMKKLVSELEEKDSIRHAVFNGYATLLRARKSHPAFHPNGGQSILDIDDKVFAVMRSSRDGNEALLCLQNIQATEVALALNIVEMGLERCKIIRDILSGNLFAVEKDTLRVTLAPFAVLWLAKSE